MSGTAVKSRRSETAQGRTGGGRYGRHWWGLVLSDLAGCALIITLMSLLPADVRSIRSELLAELAAIAISVALLALSGSYQRVVVRSREVPALLAATAIGFTAGKMLVGLLPAGSRVAEPFPAVWVLTFVSLLLVRLVRHRFAGKRSQQSPLPVVILGLTESAKGLYDALTSHSRGRRNDGRGLRIAAIFADGVEEWPEATSLDLVIGKTQWAKAFVEWCGIQWGIVAIPSLCDAKTLELVGKSAGISTYLPVAPQIAKAEVTATPVMGGQTNLEIPVGSCVAPTHCVSCLKRVVDSIGALALDILALPFLLIDRHGIDRHGLHYPGYEPVRPGLTELWQVSGRNDTSYQQRVDYDSYDVRNWSLGLDARIMAKTFRAVISGVGAY